jgi:anti-sigma regulatory factor (Ser/Thr protein kinase)
MQNGHVLTFPATRAAFAQAFSDFQRALDDYSLTGPARYRCELVFEEVVTNVIRHGHRDESAHRVRVALDGRNGKIVIRFEDDGRPFDPTKPALGARQPDRASSDGGHGLLLIRTAAESLEYERTVDDRNRLTVTIDATP